MRAWLRWWVCRSSREDVRAESAARRDVVWVVDWGRVGSEVRESRRRGRIVESVVRGARVWASMMDRVSGPLGQWRKLEDDMCSCG